MIQLQDSISLLKNFKQKFGDTYGITKLGIFGSVARGVILKTAILILL